MSALLQLNVAGTALNIAPEDGLLIGHLTGVIEEKSVPRGTPDARIVTHIRRDARAGSVDAPASIEPCPVGDRFVLFAQPGTPRVSRRSLIGRLLGFGVSAAVGTPGLATIAPHLVGQWNFGPLSPDWQPLEVATGDTLLVKARVAGSPVEAVLDSGSGASIIDVSLARTLGMADGERRTISGLGGKAAVRLIHDVEVQLGHRTRRLQFAVVADLGALSAAFGRRINMLLGADMFVGNCMALDFGNRQFALMPTASFPGGADWTPVALGHGAKQELYVSAAIAGSSAVPLMIDLGSSAALMLSSAYVDAHGL
eukprot:gene24737-26631_t